MRYNWDVKIQMQIDKVMFVYINNNKGRYLTKINIDVLVPSFSYRENLGHRSWKTITGRHREPGILSRDKVSKLRTSRP